MQYIYDSHKTPPLDLRLPRVGRGAPTLLLRCVRAAPLAGEEGGDSLSQRWLEVVDKSQALGEGIGIDDAHRQQCATETRDHAVDGRSPSRSKGHVTQGTTPRRLTSAGSRSGRGAPASRSAVPRSHRSRPGRSNRRFRGTSTLRRSSHRSGRPCSRRCHQIRRHPPRWIARPPAAMVRRSMHGSLDSR